MFTTGVGHTRTMAALTSRKVWSSLLSTFEVAKDIVLPQDRLPRENIKGGEESPCYYKNSKGWKHTVVHDKAICRIKIKRINETGNQTTTLNRFTCCLGNDFTG